MRITQRIPHILGNDVIAIEIEAEDNNGEKVSVLHPIPEEDRKGVRDWRQEEVDIIIDKIATEKNWVLFKDEEN